MSSIKYPPVLLSGDTGSGKSSCLRNVPHPERVAVLNIERKIMPSRNAMKLKSIDISSYRMLMQAMQQAMENDAIDIVFIDSFTALADLLFRYCKTQFSGYEIWSNYNDLIYEFLQGIKHNVKPVYLTGIPETFEDGFDKKKYIRVKGKEFKYGGVEKEFAIVLFTAPVVGENDKMEFGLTTQPNPYNSSKSPEGMMPDRIDNDVMVIQKCIEDYFE